LARFPTFPLNRFPRRPALLAAGLAIAAWALAACSGGSDGGNGQPGPGGNLFVNPGFENGSDPWFSLAKDASFVRAEELSHGGKASAHLQMRDALPDSGHKVYYLVQEITPQSFPDVVRGYYRVENWRHGTRKQYLQFVVIVFGGSTLPTGASNYQIRYLLAGIDSPPFPIGNAHFVFIGKNDPAEGEWVPFQANVKDDFVRLWGGVPAGFDKIRVLFEVRWDDKVAGDGEPQADVYYDDLYIGKPGGD